MLSLKNFKPEQRDALNFLKSNPKSMLMCQMGFGKTAVTLQYLQDALNVNFSVGRFILIAPKLVCSTVWKQEAQKWAETQGLRITLCMDEGGSKYADKYGNVVDGRITSNRKKYKKMTAHERRLRKAKSDHDILVINPAKLGWLRKNVKWRWDGMVVDESSKFKSSSSERWLYLADEKFGVLRYLRCVVLLTGTPMSNGYMDLWSQIYMCDRGARLGKGITSYRTRYFDSFKNPAGFSDYRLRDGSADEIKERLADICFSKKIPNDHVPRLLTEWIEPPSGRPSALYEQLRRDSLIEIEGVEIETPNAGTATNKLLQMCNGFVYDEDKVAHHIHSAKVERLKEIRDDNRGENMVVCYNFQEDLRRLKQAFPDAVLLSKSGKEVAAWNRREIPMLLCHPARAGHGLNMQYGGSLQVWYGLCWSLENYLQMNKRLPRSGQTELVRILHLAVKGWVDERLLQATARKWATQTDFINHVIRANNM